MAWDSLDMYTHGLDFFGTVVDAVPAAAWERASPCAGWTALDVLGHVGIATEVGAQILLGGDVPTDFAAPEPPSSIITGAPAAWWVGVASTGRAAAATVDDLDRVVNSPMGPRPIRDGLSFPAADLYLHGWDIAAATGAEVEFPPEAIEFIHAMFTQIPDEVVRTPGVFGPQRDAGPNPSATAGLIAFTGRDPDF